MAKIKPIWWLVIAGVVVFLVTRLPSPKLGQYVGS
jgi:hypothetical protein